MRRAGSYAPGAVGNESKSRRDFKPAIPGSRLPTPSEFGVGIGIGIENGVNAVRLIYTAVIVTGIPSRTVVPVT